MATGGTIPSNRTQTVSFYNTSAVVEKDKNIYYVPRFSKTGATAGQQVRTAYLNAFEVVCPPSSVYSNITVSQWSPQDRTLRVRGNIDDFRAVTDEGECLNYFIITRTIEKTNGETVTTQVFYYAFFITNVTQVGGGSVELTIEPDDFTNVFYLHNKKELTQSEIDNDYEPFNEKMANCYVKRQHYNRIKKPRFTTNYRLTTQFTDNFPNNVGHTYGFYSALASGEYYGDFIMMDNPRFSDNTLTCIFRDVNTLRTFAPLPLSFIVIKDLTDPTQPDWSGRVSDWIMTSQTVSYESDNMKIFMNQEESFKFKYQYRDDKYPISPYDGTFTKEERDAIEEAEEITDLSLELRNKVLLCCVAYLVVETKSPEICYKYFDIENETTVVATRSLSMGECVDSGINRPNPVVCFPFINSPQVFKKFNLERNVYMIAFINGFPSDYSTTVHPYEYNQRVLRSIISRLNKNSVSDYIHSVYIVSDIGFNKSNFDIYWSELNQGKVRIAYKLILPRNNPLDNNYKVVDEYGFYASGIREKIDDDVNGGFNIYYRNGQLDGIEGEYAGILCSNIEGNNYRLFLPVLGDIPTNLKLNFYDPVLEAEPYKFYTISSYANYELVFKKNRYYQLGVVDVNYYYSVNGGVKVSYIPNYEVDEKSSPYYNEGLTFTIASSLPLVSDSYSSYYNQNRAQMKNQYAVADKNFQYDILQHFFISGPNAVGMSATKRGWVGAVSETGNQLMQMVDETVDYFQSKEIIGMNQKAKLADVGNAPDTLKQAGSDVIYDLKTNENFLFLNHYTIDEMSYNSNAKLLERVGYQVNLYDSINVVNRVGWNYVQLNGFDWKPTVEIMTSQEEKIRQIFLNGVTLLHDKAYLTTGHNYETILE